MSDQLKQISTGYTPDPTKPRPWWKYTILRMERDWSPTPATVSVFAIHNKLEFDKFGGDIPLGWEPEMYLPYSGNPRHKKADEENRAKVVAHIAALEALDDAVYGPRRPVSPVTP